MIFAARQLQEKCKEHHTDLYMAFVDLSKAFDSVNREALWHVLRKFGCPPTFTAIIQQLHDGMQGRVSHDGLFSDLFPIRTGVKQGCVLAPTLFSIFLAAFLSVATAGLSLGVSLEYRIGGLLNIRRFQTRSKVTPVIISELQYADDLTIVAHSPSDLQAMLDAYVHAYTIFGLNVNISKTQVLAQLQCQPAAFPSPITIQGEELAYVKTFNYLGSHISSNAMLDDEVQHRICKASSAFGRLRSRVFDSGEL